MDTKYLTTHEIAQRLSVTERTVVNLVDRGYFPGALKIDPRRRNSPYRIPETAYQKYIELVQQ